MPSPTPDTPDTLPPLHLTPFLHLTHLSRLQELVDARTAHKEAMTGVERKLIEEKTRLQKEAHAQLQAIQLPKFSTSEP